MYICNYCDYSTNDKGNYSHHKKSKKHLSNIMNQLLEYLNSPLEQLLHPENNGSPKPPAIEPRIEAILKETLKIKALNEIVKLNGDIKKFTTKSTIKSLKDKYE